MSVNTLKRAQFECRYAQKSLLRVYTGHIRHQTTSNALKRAFNTLKRALFNTLKRALYIYLTVYRALPSKEHSGLYDVVYNIIVSL